MRREPAQGQVGPRRHKISHSYMDAGKGCVLATWSPSAIHRSSLRAFCLILHVTLPCPCCRALAASTAAWDGAVREWEALGSTASCDTAVIGVLQRY